MYAIGAQLEVWFHMQHSNASAAGGETLIRVLISTLAHEKRISNVELDGFACEATQTPVGFALKVASKRIIEINIFDFLCHRYYNQFRKIRYRKLYFFSIN